jgi:hypothetical protein
MSPFASLATTLQNWQRKYSQWWINRELSPFIRQGVGYKQLDFPAGELSDDAAAERVIEFIKGAIATSRQPYGFSFYLISISAVEPSAIGSGIFRCPARDFLPPFDRKSFRTGSVQESIRERVRALNQVEGKEIVVAFNSGGDLITAHYAATHPAQP